MNNTLQLQLLKSILKYDFFFFKTILNSKLEKNKYFFKKTFVKKNNKLNFLFLDLSELIKNLKQIIRVLQFIKKRNLLNIKFNRIHALEFLSFLLEKNTKVLKKIFFNKKEYIDLYQSCNVYCFIDFDVSNALYKKLLNNNKYLILEINALIKKKILGYISFLIALKIFKKLFFLLYY